MNTNVEIVATEMRKLASIIADWTGETFEDVILDYVGRFGVEGSLAEMREDAEVFEAREAYVLETER